MAGKQKREETTVSSSGLEPNESRQDADEPGVEKEEPVDLDGDIRPIRTGNEVKQAESPESHVETAEGIHRAAGSAETMIGPSFGASDGETSRYDREAVDDSRSSAERAYTTASDAMYAIEDQMSKRPWTTLFAGAVLGCFAGIFLAWRR